MYTTSEWVVQVVVPIVAAIVAAWAGNIFERKGRQKRPAKTPSGKGEAGDKGRKLLFVWVPAFVGFIASCLTIAAILRPAPPTVEITQPTTGQVIRYDTPASTGAGMFTVSGISTNIASRSDLRVFVLVHPVKPFAEGWWIQKNATTDSNGQWRSEAWAGSTEYPPHEGDSFDLIAVVARPEDANKHPHVDDPLDINPQAKSNRVSFFLGRPATPPG
jgi:hypothetical protein